MTHASLHALSENHRLRDRCSGRLSVTCASGLSSDRKLGALRAHGVGALYAHRRQRDLAAARLDVVLLDGAERIDDRPGQVSGFLEVILASTVSPFCKDSLLPSRVSNPRKIATAGTRTDRKTFRTPY
jgi:hypothetical protein